MSVSEYQPLNQPAIDLGLEKYSVTASEFVATIKQAFPGLNGFNTWQHGTEYHILWDPYVDQWIKDYFQFNMNIRYFTGIDVWEGLQAIEVPFVRG